MRRMAVVLGFLLLGLPGVSQALDRTGMALISGSAGAGFLGGAPGLGGDPSAVRDARTRLALRGGTRYMVNNHLSVGGSVGYIWNSYKGTYDLGTRQTMDTLLVITPFEVSATYSFGADYRAHRPYVGAQLGLYRWEFVSNAPFGVRQVVRDFATSQDVDHTYLGYGLTLGHEYLWRDNTSVYLEMAWHHVGANNPDLYTTAFSRRFLSTINVKEIRAGINVYFSLTGGARRPQKSATGVPARTDSVPPAPVVKGTARPEIQKENLQIVPETPEEIGGGAKKAPPAPPAAPAAADTTSGKKP
jgi:hypothetical protein